MTLAFQAPSSVIALVESHDYPLMKVSFSTYQFPSTIQTMLGMEKTAIGGAWLKGMGSKLLGMFSRKGGNLAKAPISGLAHSANKAESSALSSAVKGLTDAPKSPISAVADAGRGGSMISGKPKVMTTMTPGAAPKVPVNTGSNTLTPQVTPGNLGAGRNPVGKGAPSQSDFITQSAPMQNVTSGGTVVPEGHVAVQKARTRSPGGEPKVMPEAQMGKIRGTYRQMETRAVPSGPDKIIPTSGGADITRAGGYSRSPVRAGSNAEMGALDRATTKATPGAARTAPVTGAPPPPKGLENMTATGAPTPRPVNPAVGPGAPGAPAPPKGLENMSAPGAPPPPAPRGLENMVAPGTPSPTPGAGALTPPPGAGPAAPGTAPRGGIRGMIDRAKQPGHRVQTYPGATPAGGFPKGIDPNAAPLTPPPGAGPAVTPGPVAAPTPGPTAPTPAPITGPGASPTPGPVAAPPGAPGARPAGMSRKQWRRQQAAQAGAAPAPGGPAPAPGGPAPSNLPVQPPAGGSPAGTGGWQDYINMENAKRYGVPLAIGAGGMALLNRGGGQEQRPTVQQYY